MKSKSVLLAFVVLSVQCLIISSDPIIKNLLQINEITPNALNFSQQFDIATKLNDFDINSNEIDPNIIQDAFLKVPELITKYGYPSEVHNVNSFDGYILEMHRIPKSGAQPVLLMHGLLDSSSTWVLMGPNMGLAYMLSDLGYDVWMGNVRGNRYSRRHKSLNPENSKFWQFSWHEIGVYDLPKMIDHVLETTGYEKLHYIGHSQGSTAFWVLCDHHPEYNKKILSVQALAPVAYLKHCKSPLVRVMAPFINSVSALSKLFGMNEFLPTTTFLQLVSQVMCKDGSFTQGICSNVIFLICGFNQDNLNSTMLPVIIGHTPAGASSRQLIHYGQITKSGHFRQYDYGPAKNLIKYKSLTPPHYDLTRVTAKVALHYSANDYLSHPNDVERLYQELPNAIGKFLVADRKFNHLDFVWGINVRENLYSHLIKIMHLVEIGEL